MKVPNQILSRLDVNLQAAITKGVAMRKDYLSALHLSDKNIKEKTRNVLWSIYEKEGYHTFMRVVAEMQTFKDREFNDLIQVKGEVAEVVLEVIIQQYMKENRIDDWFVVKGLILGNEKNASFSTELDMTLITPRIVTIFEIKSFNGAKTVTNDCTLSAVNKGKTIEKDVFAQNRLHITTFWDNFGHLADTNCGVIKSVLFSFSKGDIVDKRSRDKIAVMPVYTEDTVPGFLKAVHQLDRPSTWNMDKLLTLLEKVQRNAPSADDHIAYVKSLHGDK